jgi:hypothetical protein
MPNNIKSDLSCRNVSMFLLDLSIASVYRDIWCQRACDVLFRLANILNIYNPGIQTSVPQSSLGCIY